MLSFSEKWNNMVLFSTIGLVYLIFASDRCQPDKIIGRFQDFLRKRLNPKATGIIAQTQKAKQIYLQQFQHSNIEVIGNPIRSLDGSSTHHKKENIVLTVGRLIATKHHDELIKLFIKINKPGWKLVIVGGNALKQQNMKRLRNLISKYNACEKVCLEEYQSDVDRYYKKSKIFAFTSSSEGFPNVIGEAMSAGLPVIAFDCTAGPTDMISDGINGYLISLFDFDLFQEKLQILMNQESLRTQFGNKAKKSITVFSR